MDISMNIQAKHLFRVTFAIAITLLVSTFAYAGEKISIPLSGTAVINNLTKMSISPPILDLGDVEVGVQSTAILTITNLGKTVTEAITINNVGKTGANQDEFILNIPQFTSLGPGESIEVEVTFIPVSVEEKTAALVLDTDGTSTDHIVVIKGKGIETSVSELAVSSNTLSMNTIDMGGSALKNLQVTNAGDVNAPFLNITSVDISGDNAEDFTTNQTSLTAIAPGTSQILTVTMNGSTFGEKSAALSIKHDGDNPSVKVDVVGTVKNPDVPKQTPVFTDSVLSGGSFSRPTALQFGPDGKLYVTEMNGVIYELTIQRNGKNKYAISNQKTITLISSMPNRNDNGSLNGSIAGRLITGILVVGTAQNPVIYMLSGDPRQGAGPSGNDTNLDTNSVILSKLTKSGGVWVKQDMLRGLPRSEENHQGNGLVFDKSGTKLLIMMGGNTNQGGPSNNFAKIPEYALSAAILEVDINALGTLPYDLPTLNDEDRAGVNDANDPFGGNNGKNQAILKANGPVKLYSPGFRNAYDLVMTESGRLYTFDNGGNAGWGGSPVGNCSNAMSEGGGTYHDALHYISHRGYYGGHPNPTRGNKANKFNSSNPQSPVEINANPVECNFQIPGVTDAAISKVWGSTNGMDEYTASNFGGAMKGDLLAASFDKAIYRFELNTAGTVVQSKSKVIANSGVIPLDVTAQSDNQIFPGTIWVADYQGNKISVFEPQDY